MGYSIAMDTSSRQGSHLKAVAIHGIVMASPNQSGLHPGADNITIPRGPRIDTINQLHSGQNLKEPRDAHKIVDAYQLNKYATTDEVEVTKIWARQR